MSHIIAIDLNPLEVEFDPEQVPDAERMILFLSNPTVEAEFKTQLQDAVIDAVASVIHEFEVSADFTIRVEQPKVPPVPLVKAINTVPF